MITADVVLTEPRSCFFNSSLATVAEEGTIFSTRDEGVSRWRIDSQDRTPGLTPGTSEYGPWGPGKITEFMLASVSSSLNQE